MALPALARPVRARRSDFCAKADRQDELGGLCFGSTAWFDSTIADDIYEARVLGLGGAPREDKMPKKPRTKKALKERVLLIREIMAAGAPMTSMEVTEKLGLSYSKTSHILKAMVDMGLVEAERRGIRYWYTLRGAKIGAVDQRAVAQQNEAVGQVFREGVREMEGRVIAMPTPQRPPADPPRVTEANWHTVLQSIAWAERRPVEDVVADMLDAYRGGA